MEPTEKRPNWKVWTIVGIIIILLLVGAILMIQRNKKQQIKSTIACLQEQGIVVYINGSSENWAKQQDLFKGQIPPELIIDCSLSPEAQQSCIRQKITFFPSWMKDTKIIRGIYSPESLHKKATCK